MGMQLYFMPFVMDALGDRGHRIVLEIKALDCFDEKCRRDRILAEGFKHEAQAFGAAIHIAPDILLGYRALGGMRERPCNAKFGIDGDANPCAHEGIEGNIIE